MSSSKRARAALLVALLLGGMAHAATVQLEELTSTELQQRVAQGTRTVLVPLGGTEQNGAHMALGKHNVRVRVLAGMIRSRNDRILVLQTLTETLNLQTSDVAKIETSPVSLMPDGLLGAFDETQTRDLIGYLMSTEPPRAESK